MVRWMIAAALISLPLTARGANGLRPRTPALFGEVPCVTTEEIGTVVHFEYEVPFDDTELTPGELGDSRRMQFFALRNLPFDYELPRYISQSDLDRAEANGDNTQRYSADDILETASAWPQSQWQAITADDPRVPITAAQAAMGFDWDTTAVAPGTWVVAAYTWEPENNLWSFRLGALRLVDPVDPDAAGPAAFFSMADTPLVAVGERYPMSACIDAPAGSTYTASLGILEGLDEPTWEPFVDGAVVTNGGLTLEVLAPAAASGRSFKVRLDVTDPDGKSYVAYSPFPVVVFGDDSGGSDGSGGGIGGETDQDDGGGGCRVGGRARPTLWLAGFLLLVRRRWRSRRHDDDVDRAATKLGLV